METDSKSKDYGSLKTYQYRQGSNSNIFVDLKKIAQDLKAKQKKSKKADDDDDEDEDLSISENQHDPNNRYEDWITNHGLKLLQYQSCCPNKNVPACRKKIKAATESAEPEQTRPRGSLPKPSGFKDKSPFVGQTR